MSFLDKFTPDSKNYDSDLADGVGVAKYIDRENPHDFAAEILSAEIRESENPAKKGQEFFLAAIRVTGVEQGAYRPKGSTDAMPLEEGVELSVYVPLETSNPMHAKRCFQDLCSFVAAATGEQEEKFLNNGSEIAAVLKDSGKAIQGNRVIARATEGVVAKNKKTYYNTNWLTA